MALGNLLPLDVTAGSRVEVQRRPRYAGWVMLAAHGTEWATVDDSLLGG